MKEARPEKEGKEITRRAKGKKGRQLGDSGIFIGERSSRPVPTTKITYFVQFVNTRKFQSKEEVLYATYFIRE